MIKSEKEYRNLISRAWQYTQLSYPYSSESINRANYIKGLVNDLSDLLEETKRLNKILDNTGEIVAKYSLVTVDRESGGEVDGVWLRAFDGTLRDATQTARAIEKANGSKIAVAVVNRLDNRVPVDSLRKGLKRLDFAV